MQAKHDENRAEGRGRGATPDRIPVFIYNEVKYTWAAGCAPGQRMSYKARDIDDTACVRQGGTEPPQGGGDTGVGLTCLQGSCHPSTRDRPGGGVNTLSVHVF